MLKQYIDIKKEYPDAILFFRLGDFYEMFYDDAKVASTVLGIALTSRNKSGKNPVPLCGVPHHSAEPYLAKLLQNGHRVAICEQVEDPKSAKGVVKRKVVRVLTPGAILDTEKLDSKSNNFLASIYVDKTSQSKQVNFGLAYTDISTGAFRVTSFSDLEELTDELLQIEPREILMSDDLYQGELLSVSVISSINPVITQVDSWVWDRERAEELLTEYLGIETVMPFGLEGRPESISAAGALIHYLKETQMEDMPPLDVPRYYEKTEFLLIDESSKRNLELLKSNNGGAAEGTLLWVLDQTSTPMGGRLLKHRIANPIKDIGAIEERLDALEELYNSPMLLKELRDILGNISDIERLIGRISTTSGRPRDLGALRDSSRHIVKVKLALSGSDTGVFGNISRDLDDLSDLREIIEESLVDEPPVSANDGGVIREGVSPELDELRAIRKDGKKWITELESREREATGVKTLKVGYNRVFGYYIEVSKANIEAVPESFIRKQTLVNAERFITDELKEFEDKILGAEEKILEIERELFQQLRVKIARESDRVRRTAALIGEIDVFCSLSEAAQKYDYVRPVITDSKVIELKNNRHPVVERMELGERFVPNDIRLDQDDSQFLLITGPNMAGKSTLIRQVALTVLMAQMGSFVPAAHAEIGVTDRIFTRVGATDNLMKGQSTFMVEMVETAYILRNTTERSLVILDEIGRGTSTFDGMSIAWAVSEYLHDKGSRTLFATHYHELAELAMSKSRTKNYNIYVKQSGDKIVFLRKLIPGAASHSYGIQVAKLAGVPDIVIKNARKVLTNLEKSQEGLRTSILGGQISLFTDNDGSDDREPDPVLEELRELDTNSMTPLDALTKLAELKKKLDGS
jgi:DNA mismatch repair protein MutS